MTLQPEIFNCKSSEGSSEALIDTMLETAKNSVMINLNFIKISNLVIEFLEKFILHLR